MNAEDCNPHCIPILQQLQHLQLCNCIFWNSHLLIKSCRVYLLALIDENRPAHRKPSCGRSVSSNDWQMSFSEKPAAPQKQRTNSAISSQVKLSLRVSNHVEFAHWQSSLVVQVEKASASHRLQSPMVRIGPSCYVNILRTRSGHGLRQGAGVQVGPGIPRYDL